MREAPRPDWISKHGPGSFPLALFSSLFRSSSWSYSFFLERQLLAVPTALEIMFHGEEGMASHYTQQKSPVKG